MYKLKYCLLITCLLQLCQQGVYAQDYLAQQVSVGNMGRVRMAKVLEKIAQTGKFNFAYNNRVVPGDSIVSVSGYNGSLHNFLYQLLGSDYELKVVPGYIVLRHALNRLYIVGYTEKESDQLIIKGHVSDANTKNDVGQASIYEKNLLISTLSDEHGNFSFKVKSSNKSIILTASKDNYRDTSLHLLQDVDIQLKVKRKQYKYDPAEMESGQKLAGGFSRFFISSKQRIQDLNLGGLFAYSPYQVSLTPGLSSRGMYNSQVINHLSLNLVGGYTAGVQGVEFAGVFNIDRNDVGFLQAGGVFNVVGRNVKGVQLAGVYNQVLNNATGFQAAGVLNKTHTFSGGFQMAGVANVSDSAKGFQIAGVVNSSKTVAGSQVSVINRAKKVKGFQLGFINLADSSDYCIGPINLVKNGAKSLTLSYDESYFIHLDFRSGGRVFFGLAGIAYQSGNGPVTQALDVGIGAHILRDTTWFTADGEFVAQSGFGPQQNTYQVYAIKLLTAYRVNHSWKLLAGPALNLTSYDSEARFNPTGWVLHQQANNAKLNVLSLGVTCGLQYSW